MGLFANPLSHAGYPPGVTGTPTTQPSQVRAATAAEAAAGVLTNVYISPATADSATASDFASPPVLGFGSTTPRPVHATTLSTTSTVTMGEASNIATGTTTGTKIGTATTQKLGFFNATPIVQPAAATDIKTSLVSLGLLASGASPLDLGSAALGSGTHTLSDGANLVFGSTTGTKIGTATTQKFGFFNATPVVQQLQGAITNSVTAGGSTGTIADFTDLTVYANDSAAIRNDIYQLALGLQGCIAALRTYGLLG
jgi:hypothetical protein